MARAALGPRTPADPPGPVHVPGPIVGVRTRWLSLTCSAPAIAVEVTADLRNGVGMIRRLALGTAGARPRTLVARVPRGGWEIEALELDEPTGLEITDGHQNGENPAAATQFSTTVRLGPLLALGGHSGAQISVPVGHWRAQMNAGKTANLAVDPGEVVIFGARVDDEEIVVGAEAVDEDVVDEGARGREQRGVVRLAIFELRGIVHGDVLDGGEGTGAAELDFAHVADVEETDAGAHGHVLGNEAAAGAGVFDGHVPAAEVDHPGFEGAVRGVECGLLERSGDGGNEIRHGDSFGEQGSSSFNIGTAGGGVDWGQHSHISEARCGAPRFVLLHAIETLEWVRPSQIGRNRRKGASMNRFRGIVMLMAAVLAIWKGWQIHRGDMRCWRMGWACWPWLSACGI